MYKFFGSLMLALCLVFGPMAGFGHASDNASLVQSFGDGVAYIILKAAWPTAKYENWELERVSPQSNGDRKIIFKIHAKSFWTGGSLWLQVIALVDEDYNVKEITYGDYKAVFPPGSAYKAMAAIANENQRK